MKTKTRLQYNESVKRLFSQLVSKSNIVVIGGLSSVSFDFIFVEFLIRLGFNVAVVIHDKNIDIEDNMIISQVSCKTYTSQVNLLWQTLITSVDNVKKTQTLSLNSMESYIMSIINNKCIITMGRCVPKQTMKTETVLELKNMIEYMMKIIKSTSQATKQKKTKKKEISIYAGSLSD